MTKDILRNKLTERAIKDTMAKKGYDYFANGDYNLNIIGIRSDCGGKVTNMFDDYMLLTFYVGGSLAIKVYSITTEPGKYYMQNKLGNAKGTAILVPGQYRGCWAVGKHNGKYDALVQVKPVSVYRDADKDNFYDYKNIEKWLFGINIHRASMTVTNTINIDNWSAGCQVFANNKEFAEFMTLCNEQKKRYGNSFTYTLLDEKDLIL